MIKCKFPCRYHPSSVLCAFLSQNSLKDQLLKSVDNRKNTPKTFPVEFKAASSPPVHRDEAKERCDRAVLEALSRANQNALKTGNVLLPFSAMNSAVTERGVKTGALLDVRRAGYELAEQFIMKFPESFKIRFSDKMSGAKLTYIEELCRDKKVEKAKQMFEEILVTGECEYLMDKKKDLDALIDLFAFYNVSEDMVDRPVVYNEIKQCSEYVKRTLNEDGSSEGVSVELPYSRSLFKTMDVEQRNVDYVIADLMKPDVMPRVSAEKKQKMINNIVGDEEPRSVMSISSLYEEAKNAANDNTELIYTKKEGLASLPKQSAPLYISVMEETTSLALQSLQYLKEQELVSGGNYDSVIQAAVRFHRPDLAWELYVEMREQEFLPSTDTVTDLIYSVTHSMPPEQFVKEGAPHRIKTILTDLTENPTTNITDEMFLNLFYGYHMVDFVKEEYEETDEEDRGGKSSKGKTDPKKVAYQAVRDGIHKYNYHILNEMRECMINGNFKMRYSTGYKILEMHNLTVGDHRKPYITAHLNRAMLDLYDDRPDLFVRDLDHDNCINFVTKLIYYARQGTGGFDVDDFYSKHREDLIAMKKYVSLNPDSFKASWSKLESYLSFDLKTMKGQPLPEGLFRRLEDVRRVNIIDFYNDMYKDNLEHLPVGEARNIMVEVFKFASCINPYTADVDYVLGVYKMIIQENIRISEVCIKGNAVNNDKIWTVALFTFLENFFNHFNAKYLILFFLSEDRRVPASLPGSGDIEMMQSRKLTLSETNIRDVVNLTTSALTHLLEHEGVPTTIMVYVLIKFTLLSGAYEQAWKLLDIYNTYNIPLDDNPLLNYIELTTNWESDGASYLESIAEPLQSSVRGRIEKMEREKKESTFQRYRHDQSTFSFRTPSYIC
ncbi:uncharacterized protein LOC134823511 isoform X2 [Bolinopsis microptera]|uniref:uncharacterized protein LOC134823511 isoform X2 n=1 Tax=Bolinopsis microptera TaxID=2820187 RepID=UPI00307A8A23